MSGVIRDRGILPAARADVLVRSTLVFTPIEGIYLANPACAARQVWPWLRRNVESYRCESRD
jgi:hypothetical protein